MVNKAPATVTLSNLSQTYDGTPKSPTATTNPMGLAVIFSYTQNGNPVASPTNAGSYAVTATIVDNNYQGSTTGTLVINQATLYIIANDKTRAYSDSNPAFDTTYVGFATGDNANNSLTGTQSCVTTATNSSPAGSYAITCSGQSSNNYNIVYVNGQLTITNPLVSIAVSPASPAINIGQQQQFTAVGTFQQGSRNLGSNGGTWANGTAMPTTLAGAASAELNGHLYVISGSTDSISASTAVQVYDPIAGTWASPPVAAPILTARAYARAAALGGQLYVVGGCTNPSCGGISAVLEMYDPGSNGWSSKASMPTARFDMAVGVINGKLYVAGGSGPSGPVGVLEVYDPATNSWTSKTSMTTARSAAAAGVINGKLYVAGGSTAGGPVGTLETYDPALDSWSTLASLSAPQSFAGGAALNGALYVVSGITTGATPVSTVQAYDPGSNTWTNKTAITSALYDGQPVAIGGLIYAAGNSSGNTPSLTLQVYTPGEVTWSSDTTAVATIDNTGLATGVTGGTSTITATSIFSPTIHGSTLLTVKVPITVDTLPSGLQIEVDSTTYTAPQTFNFNAGSTHTINVTSPQSGGAGKRYVWTDWSDSGTQSHSIAVPTTAKTYTANFKTQYQITFTAGGTIPIGASADTTGTLIAITGPNSYSANKAAADMAFSDWFDDGATIAATYTTPIVATLDVNKRYGLTGITGGTVTSNSTSYKVSGAPATITGTYKTQYQITFTAAGTLPIGGSADTTGTLIAISGPNSYSQMKAAANLAFSDWFDNGANITATFTTPIITTADANKRYALTGITGGTVSANVSSLTVSAGATITGTYKTQYQISFTAAGTIPIGGSADTTGTLIAIAGPNSYSQMKAAGSLAFSDWFDNGANITTTFTTPIVTTLDANKRYALTGITGGTPSGNSTSLAVSAGTTITGTYKTQYQIAFTAGGTIPIGGSADTTGTLIAIAGPNSYSQMKAAGSLAFSDWFDNGANITTTFTTPIVTTADANKRYALTGITGGTPSGNSTSLAVSAGATITGTYTTPIITTADANKRYALTGITGGTVSANVSSLTVSAGATITGTYKTQYQISFTAAGTIPIGGSADTTGTLVAITGPNSYSANKPAANLAFSDWFDNGASITTTYTTPIITTLDANKRYALTGISGGTPSGNSTSLAVSEGTTIT